jgi:hypothetical protein
MKVETVKWTCALLKEITESSFTPAIYVVTQQKDSHL